MPDMPDAPAPTPRVYAAQDRALQDEITAWERSLEAARDDAEVQAILAPAGFAPKALNALLALVTAAQTDYDGRAAAMGTEDRADRQKETLSATNRKAYAVFRDIARARLRDAAAALSALSLSDDVPGGFNPFVTHARGAYANAAAEPYVSSLAVRGYTAARFDALLADLDALVDAAKAATDARNAAKRATKTRDTAAGTARKAFAEYRDTARPLLQPDGLAGRINL